MSSDLRLSTDADLLALLKAGPGSGYDQAAVLAEIRARVVRFIRREGPDPATMAPDEIRAIREGLDMTQPEIASLCSVSARSWRSWEAGTHPIWPNVAGFLRLAEALGQHTVAVAALQVGLEQVGIRPEPEAQPEGC